MKQFFSPKELSLLQSIQDSNFPTYQSGFESTPLTADNPLLNEIFFDDKNGIRFDGVPLAHRLLKGKGFPNPQNNRNIYYGKRATKLLSNLPIEYFNYIFDASLLANVQKHLPYKDLYFLNASANRVFPHYSGESGIMHIDTYGYTNNMGSFTSDYMVQLIIYLNGTRGGLGTKLIPGSHLWYKDINTRVARALKCSDKQNRIHQREVYVELLSEDEYNSIVQIEADPGDVLLFRSDLLHSIPANESTDLYRDVVIANFSSSNVFSKRNSSKDSSKLKSVVSSIPNLDISSTKNFLFYDFFNFIVKPFKRFSIRLFQLLSNSYHALNLYYSHQAKYYDQILFFGDICPPALNASNFISVPSLYSNSKTNLYDCLSLPYQSDSIQALYSSHCIHFLTLDECFKHLQEVFRITIPGGHYRIAVPSINLLFQNYDSRNLYFFNWMRNKSIYKYDSWFRMIVRSFAGMVVDQFSDSELLSMYKSKKHVDFIDYFNGLSNQCTDKHKHLPFVSKSGYYYELIEHQLRKVGFSQVIQSNQFHSNFKLFRNKYIFDMSRPTFSMYIEAVK
ncbi:phytanoyl-CoA dioxygenase family protein [bacterium]|nr:phytanoyl-CoA dioxygenase family protein [bacterium]